LSAVGCPLQVLVRSSREFTVGKQADATYRFANEISKA